MLLWTGLFKFQSSVGNGLGCWCAADGHSVLTVGGCWGIFEVLRSAFVAAIMEFSSGIGFGGVVGGRRTGVVYKTCECSSFYTFF